MFNANLIVLSYHRFGLVPDDYQYSRTYRQLIHDVKTKTFDWITIDDGHESLNMVSHLLRAHNIRAKFFITTSLIGTPGYCTWKDLIKFSEHHDIENHSHNHINLQEVTYKEVENNIATANELIEKHIGRRPRYFVPPFNKWDLNVKEVCEKLNLTIVTDRIDILNTTE